MKLGWSCFNRAGDSASITTAPASSRLRTSATAWLWVSSGRWKLVFVSALHSVVCQKCGTAGRR
jgi:hypothetical protein